MAFTRAYMTQHAGDPAPGGARAVRRLRSMRAGRLISAQGDPFKFGKFFKRAFKPPKAVRKFQLGRALGKVAQFAAPLLPGVGGLAGIALGALGGGAGQPVSVPSIAPELMEQQEGLQTPVQLPVPRYEVPGITVSATRLHSGGRRRDLMQLLEQLLAEESGDIADDAEVELDELPFADYQGEE